MYVSFHNDDFEIIIKKKIKDVDLNWSNFYRVQ